MEGILRVTPETLIQTSSEFASMGSQIKNLTGEMLSLVKSLSSVWDGEAAAAYGNKFDSLAPDMEKLYRMVQEHVQDLQEMAGEYKTAESGNMEQGGSLKSNIIS
jgi:WXG100 family type VII secretion target